MNNKKKIIFVIIFVIVDIFLILGYLTIRDATNINNFDKEMKEINKLDLSSDRFNRKIKTSGKYKIVEKAIKEYLDDYSLEMLEIYEIIQDDRLSTILSYDNYEKDGPLFKSSLKYLNNTKTKFNDTIDEMINELDEEKMSNYILDYTSDDYYVDLYRKSILSSDLVNQYNENRDLLIKTNNNYNNIFDTSIDVLNFLVLYKDDWKIEDGEIKFQNKNLLNYYNDLVNRVK